MNSKIITNIIIWINQLLIEKIRVNNMAIDWSHCVKNNCKRVLQHSTTPSEFFLETENFSFYYRVLRSAGVMTYPAVTFKFSVKHNLDRRDAVGLPIYYRRYCHGNALFIFFHHSVIFIEIIYYCYYIALLYSASPYRWTRELFLGRSDVRRNTKTAHGAMIYNPDKI